KAELIIMGGTFPSFPLDYQEEFVQFAFKALNDFSGLFYTNDDSAKNNDSAENEFNRFNYVNEFNYVKFKEFFELPSADFGSEERTKKIQEKILKLKYKIIDKATNEITNKATNNTAKKTSPRQQTTNTKRQQNVNKTETTLEKEQLRNETAKIRCVALCIETRPDYGMLEHGNQMLKLGATRVELGIQSVYDDILKRIKRGHTADETKKSLCILKDLGFKVAAHYMPGLPGVDKKKDLKGMKLLFEDADYRPDMLKIYPCMVIKGTKLYEEYKKGKFTPLNAKEAAKLIVEFKKSIPEYCRVQRVQRDIPTSLTEAGAEMTNLRQYMHNKFDVQCRCIRCREPKKKRINWSKIKIKTYAYSSSQGKEFFISAEDTKNDLLAGFCRLRFPSQVLRKEITKNSALLRELHVYGTAAGLSEKGEVQHRGLGKKLMERAEKIAVKYGKDKIVVISGIGVRGYYKKLGYEKEGGYMVKMVKKREN
ncbi:MAG: tRNA uridine(34) 5-carboxymethylaminomethyl modification radical SAM/GNAT enzyme Elp3, partial [Nanoarchaeota archaeon]